jgi:hypothetical protein
MFVTLMKEAPGFSETSVLTKATRRNNPEDTILHSHRRENLKSYMDLFPSSGEGGGGTYSTEKPKACLSTGDARTKEGQPLETRGL